MKCLQVKDGVIEHIMLNEACSSGCGSFIESFAVSMNMTVQEFAQAAVRATSPVDLGSRCTVFMNSRVKQAQKEGATIGDVAAGLSYSVIKNALFKVIKLRDFDEIGENCVVQGGTFMSDATLRAFEKLTGKDVIRPDVAGCMGAYGAALLARDRAGANGASSVLDRAAIDALQVRHTNVHCGRCSNNCLLTINDFGGGHRFITGNRCERGAGGSKRASNDAPNLFEFKNRLLFDRPVLDPDEAPHGTVGIPRALNMYENYPFWHAFFTRLGFSVVLSDQTNGRTYEAGIESMPSESACYPAKLSHGHIMNLLEKDPDFIWMPCIRWERKEDPAATNHYNCPIVMSYPQALGLNVDELSDPSVEYLAPFLPYDKKSELKRRLYEVVSVQREADAAKGRGRFRGEHITRAQVDDAVNYAWQADLDFKQAMRRKGDEALAWIEGHHAHGIVLAGRPYHNDPEIDRASPSWCTPSASPCSPRTAWPTRCCPSARFASWTSGCTTRACTARRASWRARQRPGHRSASSRSAAASTPSPPTRSRRSSRPPAEYTVLKIDQVSNLGAARIRVRSLMAALGEQAAEVQRRAAAGELSEAEPVGVVDAEGRPEGRRDTNTALYAPVYRETKSAAFPKVRYTKEMQREGYTILAPQMSPIHFELIEALVRSEGYNVVLLPSVDQGAVDMGLKYVNNDICYPSILVTGQIMEAVLSGKYDLSRTAVLISQPAAAAAPPTTSPSSARPSRTPATPRCPSSRCPPRAAWTRTTPASTCSSRASSSRRSTRCSSVTSSCSCSTAAARTRPCRALPTSCSDA